jgi:CheY-like chemotaxis protein
MAEAKQKILIVEENLDLADMLDAYFSVQGYEVLTVNRGEDGVRACEAESHPDLILLDTVLPDMRGDEVTRRIRSNERNAKIPIIFLIEESEYKEDLKEFEGDIHLIKPFDVQELRDCVIRAFLPTREDRQTHLITGLPVGTSVEERIKGCLDCTDWVILLISLNNLDAYGEAYGPPAADDVLRTISLMVHNTVRSSGGDEDFLGHLGATDFILITQPERGGRLRESIFSRLVQSLEYFYPIKDREPTTLGIKRLNVRIDVLKPEDGAFTSLDSLKSALMDR